MPKLLTRLKITEVSAVDRGAGDGTKIVLMKRDDDVPRSKPHVERHARRLRKFQEIFEGKDGGDDDAGTEKRVDHSSSTIADLLVESGRVPHRTAALDHLLNSPHGNALLARLHKAADQTAKETTPMTSHSEFVQSVVKQYGIVALAKSMVQDQKSYGLDEHQFTQLATEHAQRVYSNDRPDVAFSKLYQSEESVRRACQVVKAQTRACDGRRA
jgi:hypothetical protein